MNKDDFDDIIKIFEARDASEEAFTLLDDELFELPDRQNWRKDNNQASAKTQPSFVVEKSMHDENYFNLIGADSISETYTLSDLKRFGAVKKKQKRKEILENIGYGLLDKIEDIIDNNSGGLLMGLLVAGFCVVSTMDAKSWDLEKVSRQETPKAKYESVEDTNTYINKTTFVQKEDGSVTNITETDVYKEFEEYARSNDLIMNKENFEAFCDIYYSQNTSRRGR